MFKKIDTYFYISLVAYVFVIFGVKPDSITLNLWVLQLNNIKIVDLERSLQFFIVVSAFLSVFFNFRKLRNEYFRAVSNNDDLNFHVTKSLQGVTGDADDRVNSSFLSGWVNPSVDTGRWTSFKSAREVVVISVPFFLALMVRVLGLLVSVFITKWQVAVPLFIGVGCIFLMLFETG